MGGGEGGGGAGPGGGGGASLRDATRKEEVAQVG
jgi:hypothetical protein